MQVDSPSMIRNIALVGHADTGKTTLASALLYTGGVVNRMNRVEDKNTITDFDDQEHDLGHSIGLAPCFVPWHGHKVNVLDAPGSGMFELEGRSAMRDPPENRGREAASLMVSSSGEARYPRVSHSAPFWQVPPGASLLSAPPQAGSRRALSTQ